MGSGSKTIIQTLEDNGFDKEKIYMVMLLKLL